MSWSVLRGFSARAIFALVLAAPGFAQQRWQRTYGGTGEDAGSAVQQTFDGGYIVTGLTTSAGSGGYDVYLIKTDSSGDTIWSRTYGGPSDDQGMSVRQTSDSGYIIAGTTSSFGAGGNDVYLVRTNSEGETLWTRTYGGAYDDQAWSVVQTSDGGFIVAGSSDAGLYLVKTKSSGDSEWTRRYGGTNGSNGMAVEETSDSGYIIAGETNSQDGDVWLVRTDARGDTIWTRAYGGANSDYGASVRQTPDGGFIVAGVTYSFGTGQRTGYLVRTDACGDTLWTRTCQRSLDDGCSSVCLSRDGGYVVTGWTLALPSSDVYLAKTNASGETLWTRAYGGSDLDCGYSVQQTSDNGFIVAATTMSYGAGYDDVYLIKTDSLGNTAPYSVAERQAPSAQIPPSLSLSSSPTLFTQSTTLNYTLPGDAKSARLEIRDITGRLVRTESPLTLTLSPKGRGSEGRLTWDGCDNNGQRLPSGCHFCTLRTGTHAATTGVILTR